MVAAPHAALHVETHRAVLFPGPQDVKGASEGLQFPPQAHAVSSEFAARVIPVGLFSGIARRRPEIRPASLTLTRFVSCRLLLDRSETQNRPEARNTLGHRAKIPPQPFSARGWPI